VLQCLCLGISCGFTTAQTFSLWQVEQAEVSGTLTICSVKDTLDRKRGDKPNQNRVNEDRKDGKEKWTEKEIKKKRKQEQGEFFKGGGGEGVGRQERDWGMGGRRGGGGFMDMSYHT
jgi:hypothetical protein